MIASDQDARTQLDRQLDAAFFVLDLRHSHTPAKQLRAMARKRGLAVGKHAYDVLMALYEDMKEK